MNSKELRELFERELGELTEGDLAVIEANRRFEEASKIISGTK